MNHLRTVTLALCAATAVAATAAPRLRWLSTLCDFGAFSEEEGRVTALFKAVNEGDEPVVVIEARANCGCTTPQYSTSPVAPGDTLTLSVSYDPDGRPGRFSKNVHVDTNTEPSRSKLTVKGVVIGKPATVAARYPVAMGPLLMSRSAELFGVIRKGHVRVEFDRGYSRAARTLRPAFRDCPEWLKVTAAPDTLPPGEQFTLNFYINPDKTPLYGVVQDTITIVPDPEGAPDSVYPLPVIATFEEDFSRLTPGERAKAPVADLRLQRIDLTAADGGFINVLSSDMRDVIHSDADGRITVTFPVRNDGRSPLLIRRVYTTASGISLKMSDMKIKPGKTATLTVTAPAPAPGHTVNSRITVITNDPANPVQTLRLTIVTPDAG